MEWEERSLKETEGVVRERGGGRREGAGIGDHWRKGFGTEGVASSFMI